MRGTLQDRPGEFIHVRFIPAHAGNTGPVPPWLAQASVHPRACGEHNPWVMATILGLGSSPRMRGTLKALEGHLVLGRFIPAHAGNTSGSRKWCNPPAVHPRACGEHNKINSIDVHDPGSSPRMRGTRLFPQGEHSHHRFIPAHAGNTSGSELLCAYCPVHPRACGEHH